MSFVIFQHIDQFGSIKSHHIDWSTDYDKAYELLGEIIDKIQETNTVFLVIDEYSEFKERKVKASEKIISQQIEKIDVEQASLWRKED